MTPLVSVVMPVYQGERWLSEALESVFAQTFEDLELIAVDDGSTDRSVAILEDWSRRESRLRVVQAAHGGVTRARERALQEARGRFAAFLDQDDRWLPNRLERQLPHVDDDTLVFSDTYLATLDEEAWGTASSLVPRPSIPWPAQRGVLALLLEQNFIPVLTVLAPVRRLLEAGSFRRAERMGFGSAGGSGDYEMWLALALNGIRFHYVAEPLAIYRYHSTQASADVFRSAAERLLVLDSFEGEVSGSDLKALRRGRRAERKRLEVAHRKEAWRLLLAGDRRAARRHLLASLRARPATLRPWVALALFYVPPAVNRAAVRGTA